MLLTVPFCHFLFSRYLDLTECPFSSDILVPFPDLSDFYSRAFAELVQLVHDELVKPVQTAAPTRNIAAAT